ncbi:MAG: c-type cytochrome [Candidatus Thiodiazotropha taylori]|uniref:C-type cytochrome n=1 Tax=Candidatus Thiodiazotropha taylori TaxID=2792791 RepID=A0A9E4U370_9GAMM|nr:c-type cytochrome [Candidatus Thiodiazotropha taylori]MCG7957151.1 c-type cytochrome [Candidatus Thiodiazotropha taylori]MCG7965641.1 c-type cytochrome [Candidatus Thiodiazotropha taylori]MCG8027971.1 c-type cytochrome [Candidatus Thiodiazotropha taylori]MCG8040981.1 c-type cytochrome [Candidatus Thiodiazotropha taylori]
MKNRKARLLALTAAVIFSGSLAAEGVRTPSMLANTCAGCHGTLGASAGDLMPIIGGMEKEFLQMILLEYKTGERDSTIMGRIAKGYSDAELKAIAAFMADQEWVSSPVKTDSKMVAIGQKIHDKQCKTCHEDNGRVQEDEAPRLAGQWPEYTMYYLEWCHSKGKRCQPRKMGKRVMKLSKEELKAMAEFYASEK